MFSHDYSLLGLTMKCNRCGSIPLARKVRPVPHIISCTKTPGVAVEN